MVCATITRDPILVNTQTARAIRDALHRSIVKTLDVKGEDVEIRVRKIGPLDINSSALGIEIDSGSGKDGWRIEKCPDILTQINQHLVAENVVPKDLCAKGKSNVWLRIFAKGASMPIGCPDDMH